MSEITEPLEGHCSSIVKEYDLFNDNCIKLIDSIAYKNNYDFIIINKPLKSLLDTNPVLSILKFNNQNDYHTIHKHYLYDEDKKQFHLVTDSSMAGYKPEKEFKILEDYFYNSISNDKLYTNYDVAKEHYQMINRYYVIARVSGKIITKTIYFADDYNNQ